MPSQCRRSRTVGRPGIGGDGLGVSGRPADGLIPRDTRLSAPGRGGSRYCAAMVKIDPSSKLARATRKMATSGPFRKVAPKVLPPLDRALHRVSRGKLSVSGAMVPSMVLTTTGVKSGLPRQTPLACVPDGQGWYVVGSNFGREKHPAWTGNLLADPLASVDRRGRTTEVRARLLTETEKEKVWPDLVAVWPAYDDYVELSHRSLRVFRLDPR